MVTERLTALIATFCEASGLAASTVSSRVFNDGKTVPALLEGRVTITLRRADKLLAWLDAHWPIGVAWPADIARPSVDSARAA